MKKLLKFKLRIFKSFTEQRYDAAMGIIDQLEIKFEKLHLNDSLVDEILSIKSQITQLTNSGDLKRERESTENSSFQDMFLA